MWRFFLVLTAIGFGFLNPAHSCTFFIATGNAGVLISTSPIGAILSDDDHAKLVAIEKRLNAGVSLLIANAPRINNPWPMLRALTARQNFFAERANEYWKSYDKEKKSWLSSQAKKQFLIFNSRALEDLRGIINVIEVLAEIHSDNREMANRAVSFESLSGAIISKVHRQLVAQEESHFSKEFYEIVMKDGSPPERFEALFWEVELATGEINSHLPKANVSMDQLANHRVRYILVPGLHLQTGAPKVASVYFDADTRQLHFLMPLQSILKNLRSVGMEIEAVPFRMSSM